MDSFLRVKRPTMDDLSVYAGNIVRQLNSTDLEDIFIDVGVFVLPRSLRMIGTTCGGVTHFAWCPTEDESGIMTVGKLFLIFPDLG